MDTFFVVSLFNYFPAPLEWEKLNEMAVNNCCCIGIEEFSVDEPTVDEILGERSYSGGDLPLSIIKEVEDRILGKPTHYRFFFDSKEDSQKFSEFCSRLLCEVQVEEVPQQDWNAEWKKHYAPIKVNSIFEIIPSWMVDYRPTSRESVLIYPGMGFGTGSHETTFLCLKLFTEKLLTLSIDSVLDFGSGSGILGLSVFKFYPQCFVDFYDIDIEANKNCYQNAILNNFQNNKFRLLLPDFREQLSQSYDLVFANILEVVLLQEKDFLINKTKIGGHIILSGLLTHQVSNVLEKYTLNGMILVDKQEKGDWAAALLRREK